MEKTIKELTIKLANTLEAMNNKLAARTTGMCKADMETAIVGLVNKVDSLEAEIKKLKAK